MSEEVKKNYFTTGQMRNALMQIEDKMVHSNWMPTSYLGSTGVVAYREYTYHTD